jgi:hypothetical protein
VRPYLEKKIHKNRTGRVAQDEGPEFKPQYLKKKKKKKEPTKIFKFFGLGYSSRDRATI